MLEKLAGRLTIDYPRSMASDLLSYTSILNNWWDIIFFKTGIIRNFRLRLKDGRTIAIRSRNEYAKIIPSLLTDYKFQECLKRHPQSHIYVNERTIKVGDVVFGYSTADVRSQSMMAIKETFLEKAYAWLRVRNRTVVDVGANIGDTALYFATSGARHVYSLEPYPHSFNIMLKNVKASGLGDKITAINAGIGAKDTSILVDPGYKNNGCDDLRRFKRGKKIPVVCFGTLLKTYNIGDAVLKIDCEGCEYESILNSPKETLRKFSQIQMEYHYGYRLLVKYLKGCGFKVRHTAPRWDPNKRAQDSNMYVGFIYAERE